MFIGYFELVAGLGFLFGPLIGAVTYSIFGYIGPFYVVGGLYLIMIIAFRQVAKGLVLIED